MEASNRIRGAKSKNSPTFRTMLDTLGDSSSLAIVVGSGASIDATLPSWRTLVTRILLETHRITPGTARMLIDKYGPVQACTIARANLRMAEDWISVVRRALYDSSARFAGGVVHPGPLLVALARLAVAYDVCAIFTTNFDDLLESALADAVAASGHGVPEVIHLHGLIRQDGRSSRFLALDEIGYSEMSRSAAGRLRKGLARHPALFVGMGLTEAHIIEGLYHAGKRKTPGAYSPPHSRFGIFPAADEEHDEQLIGTMNVRRLASLGVSAHVVNSYEEVTQHVAELLLRRQSGTHYWTDRGAAGLDGDPARALRFSQRVEAWEEEMGRRLPPSVKRSRHMRGWNDSELADYPQAVVHRTLQRTVQQLETDLRGRGWSPEADERLACHVWIRSHVTTVGAVLDLLGSSWAFYANRVRDSRPQFRIKIDRSHRYIAVEAANAGAPTTWILPGASRWKTQIAIPIFLENPPWHRLLVGVIVFCSTAIWASASSGSDLDEGGSGETLDPALVSYITEQMSRFGQAILNPSEPLPAFEQPEESPSAHL